MSCRTSPTDAEPSLLPAAMRIHLPRLGATPWVDLQVDELESLVAMDRFGVHELTDDPEFADVILYVQCHMVDWRLTQILNHDVARRFWPKVMVYDERDKPWRSMPGLDVSQPASSFKPERQRAWSYLRSATVATPVETDPDLLFSFVGSDSAPCRTPLFAIRHRDAIVEEVRNFMFWDTASPNFEARRERYLSVLGRSRFVLCPRGRGTSTIRLFETLAAGRVPVVISDEWVAPDGPKWEEFVVRLPERQAASLTNVLEERNPDWPVMREAAASAYSEFFSAQVAFHRIVEALDGIRGEGARASSRIRVLARGAAVAARQSWPSHQVSERLRRSATAETK